MQSKFPLLMSVHMFCFPLISFAAAFAILRLSRSACILLPVRRASPRFSTTDRKAASPPEKIPAHVGRRRDRRHPGIVTTKLANLRLCQEEGLIFPK